MERLDIQDYIKPLLRWWWLLLIATVLAACASYFYTVRQPEVYTSQATLMVGSVLGQADPDQNAFFVSQALAVTYAETGMADAVRQATMEALDMQWLPFYWIQSVPNSPMIEVFVSAEIPELAQTVAAELVNQLILQGPSGQQGAGSQQFILSRLAKLETDITGTEAEIDATRAKLADLFSAREIAAVNEEIAALELKLGALNDDYIDYLNQTNIESPNTINIIGPATLPTVPDASNLWLNVFLAAAVGLVLASGGAYLLEYLDDTVKTSESIKKQLGLNTLSAIPAFVESKSNVLSGNVAVDDSKLVMLNNPNSAHAEAFRILRTNIQYADINRRFRNILITSPEPGDGKSTVIANLGMALAQAGKRVIIIDADLHRPTQHQVFQVPNTVGVTTALFGGVTNVTQLLHPTRTPGLRILTSGPLPPNPSELLGSDLMSQLLDVLEHEADIILMDSPPATILIDAATLSVQADAVVLVVRAGKTSRNTARQAVEALGQVKANVAGVILNGVSIQNTGYHYNYNRYGYKHHDSSAPVGRPPASGPAPRQPGMPPGQAGMQSPNGYGYGQHPHPHASPRSNPGMGMPRQAQRSGSRPGTQPGTQPSTRAGNPGQSNRQPRMSKSGYPSQGYPSQGQRGIYQGPPEGKRGPNPRSRPPQRGANNANRGPARNGVYGPPGMHGPAGPSSGYPGAPDLNGATSSFPTYGYAMDPRMGADVDSYGHAEGPSAKPPPKKGFGRFWRS